MSLPRTEPHCRLSRGRFDACREEAGKLPETGWGEMFQNYFDEKKVKIENHAQKRQKHKILFLKIAGRRL